MKKGNGPSSGTVTFHATVAPGVPMPSTYVPFAALAPGHWLLCLAPPASSSVAASVLPESNCVGVAEGVGWVLGAVEATGGGVVAALLLPSPSLPSPLVIANAMPIATAATTATAAMSRPLRLGVPPPPPPCPAPRYPPGPDGASGRAPCGGC